MTNNTDYLIELIRRAIPIEILERGLSTPTLLTTMKPSLNHQLNSIIISGWILRDANVTAGVEVILDMNFANFRTVNNGTIIEIPPALTGGREITSVLSIAYGTTLGTVGSNLTSTAEGPINAVDSRIQLVGPNIIFVEEGLIIANMHLRCMLENNSDFSNISTRALPYLGEMGVLATKSYIYNKLTIPIAENAIIAGVSIGRFSEIINEWADSLEMYNEMRKKWNKINLLQDSVSHGRLIRSLMPR